MTRTDTALTQTHTTLTFPGTVTETGLQLRGGLSLDEWRAVGDTLRRVESGALWWVGDWLAYGEKSYGGTYTAAAEATGYEYDTVKRSKWVAEQFELCRRRHDLPWSHHLEVAAMEPAVADAWLRRAHEGQWSRDELRRQIKAAKRQTKLKELDDIAAVEAKAAAGVYDVIVIDPPWPMEKIEREVRPNQVAFDYPVMTLDEIARLEIPCADDCHVWVWTTQRFLPATFDLLEAWGLKYVCTFGWHKPGGFQPCYLPQYNLEFAVYARRGAPAFLETKNLPLCFNAARGKHSEKPEEFYEMVRRVTNGRRLDMFNRRPIDGFEGWGNEAAEPGAEVAP